MTVNSQTQSMLSSITLTLHHMGSEIIALKEQSRQPEVRLKKKKVMCSYQGYQLSFSPWLTVLHELLCLIMIHVRACIFMLAHLYTCEHLQPHSQATLFLFALTRVKSEKW